MTIETATVQTDGQVVRAGSIDIHYVEPGAGEQLLLLHGGVVSTSHVWAGNPFAYVSHMETLAQHFRVIAPDARGAGRTINPDGSSSFTQLADDVAALIDVLGLDRPLVCGFSEGGTTATIVGIRHPESVRAIVNHAGYDLFNPEAPSFQMMRQMMGGSPDAQKADPDAVERFFGQSDEIRATFELMQADLGGARGPGSWRTYIADLFDRCSRSPGVTFDDLRGITAPTLILTGDRDHFCSVEEGATAYRMLEHGELVILPNHGHVITPAAIAVALEFLRRQ